jgi:hypothetical protein
MCQQDDCESKVVEIVQSLQREEERTANNEWTGFVNQYEYIVSKDYDTITKEAT